MRGVSFFWFGRGGGGGELVSKISTGQQKHISRKRHMKPLYFLGQPVPDFELFALSHSSEWRLLLPSVCT